MYPLYVQHLSFSVFTLSILLRSVEGNSVVVLVESHVIDDVEYKFFPSWYQDGKTYIFHHINLAPYVYKLTSSSVVLIFFIRVIFTVIFIRAFKLPSIFWEHHWKSMGFRKYPGSLETSASHSYHYLLHKCNHYTTRKNDENVFLDATWWKSNKFLLTTH